ncbi:hypothetical protein CASFOL_014905 [Castilleja foliolosa]|uniref:Phytocyanin domain-containing protein n=1 Tax=Castilleja foliolosa TaxID=1961234 RepID=A0ABD3DE14_9LAMI
MAQTTNSRISIQVFRVFGILSVLLLIQESHAFDFKVGGSIGWTAPKDPNAATYNLWAEKNRFQTGDTLLFAYAVGHDTVLHVTKNDYTNCNTDTPLEKFTDGHTVFKFNQSGPHYFISGIADNCHKNEKLVVIVMADRSKNNGTVTTPSPSPTPDSDKVSPPSPAPAGEESPSPPSPGADMNPIPAPSQESSPPKKNSASSMVTGVVGIIVAVVFGLSLLL